MVIDDLAKQGLSEDELAVIEEEVTAELATYEFSPVATVEVSEATITEAV